MKSMLVLAAALSLAVSGTEPATACESQGGYVASIDADLRPLSVPAAEIGAWLNASPYSSGIRFTSELHGRDLWLDVTAFPDEAPEVGSVRALMQLGRVVAADFDQLVLVDGDEALFVIGEPDLRRVGCQFIWPAHAGTDPIHLMREIVEALHEGQNRQPLKGLSPSGSAGTTIHAVALIEGQINPVWLDTARPGAASPEPEDRNSDRLVALKAPRVQAMAVSVPGAIILGGL